MITTNTQTVIINKKAIADRGGNFKIIKNFHVALLMNCPFSFLKFTFEYLYAQIRVINNFDLNRMF